MIKDNRLSLKEISTMVGIDDQLYFSRLFKKCMGIFSLRNTGNDFISKSQKGMKPQI